jgi:outer membrane protein assembly factor BamB
MWRRSSTLLATCVTFATFGGCLSNDAGDEESGVESESGSSDWSTYSFNSSNTNANLNEDRISTYNVDRLRHAWETFNDDAQVPTPPPTGFVLESVLGLRYPNSVVGVISPPIIRSGTIYYIDELGTMFARNARTGGVTDSSRHWTRTLVDPDFDAGNPAIAPDLYYSGLADDGSLLWIQSSFYGRLHAVRKTGGNEVDFDPATPGTQPFIVAPDQVLASALGQPVIVSTGGCTHAAGTRKLFITELNVILNDALVQGAEGGLIIAIDITNPAAPFEAWRRATIDINPATGLRFGTGVSAGSGLAVDFDRHLIVGGTGQNTSVPYAGYPGPGAPAGYIDRSDAIYAIDFRTGQFVWVNQLHVGDVFNLNQPVPTGPSDPIADDDVLSPPVLFRANGRDLVGCGSKRGLYKVVSRSTGQTVWQRQISKGNGLGGIQAGGAFANGTIFIDGFEGIDDGWANASFNAPGANFFNAFFATFSPAFWADVEDVRNDSNPATGVQTKVFALDAGTGSVRWSKTLAAGGAFRHVSWANNVLYVTTTSGKLFALNASNGDQKFTDQTLDLNARFNLGLGKPHHAAMNAGTLISNGMVYVPYGGQNNPSGGIIAYKLP